MSKIREKIANYIDIVGVEKLLNEDKLAQTKLFNYVKHLLTYICFKHYIINENDDIINDTMNTFFKQISIKKPQNSERMSIYMLTIHYHNCFDETKKTKSKNKTKIYSVDDIGEVGLFSNITSAVFRSLSNKIGTTEPNIIDYTRLYNALHTLTPRQRAIIQDYFFENHCEESLEETANRLGITYAIAKRDLYRGYTKIKKELNKQGINTTRYFF